MTKINAIFLSKEKVRFSSRYSTRINEEIVKIDFKNVYLTEHTLKVTGIWSFTDSEGKQRKINDISFTMPNAMVAQTEHMIGRITEASIYSYVTKRIQQVFPSILDQEHASDPQSNFGLKGEDVEILTS
jgi:hypothetical protein